MPREGDELKGPRDVRVHTAGPQPGVSRRVGPVRLEPDSDPLGAIIVAKPRTELRDQWLPLVGRLAAAVAVGRAPRWSALGWWLSRKITGPVLALSERGREIAAGNYAVRVPGRRRRGRDQPPLGAIQRDGSAPRGDRGAGAAVPDVGLARAPHAADGDQGPRRRDPRRAVRRSRARAASLDVVAAETMRLERLVGDVLDLAKLNAHRFTVHAQEVDIGALVEQAHASFGEEARRREIDFRLTEEPDAPTIVTDGDRVLQVITQPARERVSLDTRRRHGLARLDDRERGRPHRRPRHRAGHPAGRARADLRAVHLARQPWHRLVCRSLASWRMRSAAGSSSSRPWARAAAFGLVLPASAGARARARTIRAQ